MIPVCLWLLKKTRSPKSLSFVSITLSSEAAFDKTLTSETEGDTSAIAVTS